MCHHLLPRSPQVATFFSTIDVNKNGTLDAKELQQALAMGNLKYGINDMDLMVTAFDSSGSRSLTLTEFTALHSFLTNALDSFRVADAQRVGALGIDELEASLKTMGFTIDRPALSALVKRHDSDRNQKLKVGQFVRLSLFMHSSMRTFSAFDTQRAGSITLNFSQFVYATSHVV
jgi:Ca2+-binding EF-hand superfamily protein